MRSHLAIMNQEQNSKLLLAIQKGLPLEKNPFNAIAQELGSSEDEVLSQIKQLFDEGKARRIGGIFDARRLGYKSALCALTTTPENRDELAALVTPNSGTTHCYLRGWPEELDTSLPAHAESYPELWFTLATPAEDFDAQINKLREATASANLLILPAIRRFKIDVIFNPTDLKKGERFPGAPPITTEEDNNTFRNFSEEEKQLVRLMDGNIPITPTPFADIAKQLGLEVEDMLNTLKSWKKDGILRRTAVILRHHKIGFKANAMCTWSVPEDQALEAGRALASNPEVTHCYQRVIDPIFPYNLFAMIHTRNWDETHQLFLKIGNNAGLSDGKMLCSVKEYKKTSMKYFQ